MSAEMKAKVLAKCGEFRELEMRRAINTDWDVERYKNGKKALIRHKHGVKCRLEFHADLPDTDEVWPLAHAVLFGESQEAPNAAVFKSFDHALAVLKSVIPYPNQIQRIEDVKIGLNFVWRGINFRLEYECGSVYERSGTMLGGTNPAILLEHLIKGHLKPDPLAADWELLASVADSIDWIDATVKVDSANCVELADRCAEALSRMCGMEGGGK